MFCIQQNNGSTIWYYSPIAIPACTVILVTSWSHMAGCDTAQPVLKALFVYTLVHACTLIHRIDVSASVVRGRTERHNQFEECGLRAWEIPVLPMSHRGIHLTAMDLGVLTSYIWHHKGRDTWVYSYIIHRTPYRQGYMHVYVSVRMDIQ